MKPLAATFVLLLVLILDMATAAAQPKVATDTIGLPFGQQRAGTDSAPAIVKVMNQGAADLDIGALLIQSKAPRRRASTSATSSPTPTPSRAP